MDVTLYKNFSVEKKVDKNITQIARYTGVQMVEPVNDADITIQMTIPTDTLKWSNVNYFAFDGAYYYVDSVDKVANGVTQMNGRMDLLMTYREGIKELQVKVLRSTSHGSARLEDDLRQYSVDSTKAVVKFPRPFDTTESGGYYVVVTSQRGYTSS